ncbi:site-specific DNA-methyltransferase [Thermogymnomonas acidicola]|nr:DNA methyltransferase [Thermogymnomonas acidicola]
MKEGNARFSQVEFVNRVFLGDALEVMRRIPGGSVDMIFADPPYNLMLQDPLYRPNQERFEGVSEEWDRFASFGEYDAFTESWLRECRRLLKEDGTIWAIGTYHNIFRVGKIMQDLGFWILNDVVWIKANPTPNFRGTRFNNAHETLIWAARDRESRYTFNYRTMKAYNDDLQMRSDWHIPVCQGKERVRIGGRKAHPTQKPEALLYRVITSCTKPGDIILDPFAGTGTTLAVAKRLGRRYIGIEKNEAYLRVCEERLRRTVPYPEDILPNRLEERPRRVPFGELIERGYILPGEFIYSPDRTYRATVMADATVTCGGLTGSIHRVSAQLLGKDANNGWHFWFVEREGTMVSIDELRQRAIRDGGEPPQQA